MQTGPWGTSLELSPHLLGNGESVAGEHCSLTHRGSVPAKETPAADAASETGRHRGTTKPAAEAGGL